MMPRAMGAPATRCGVDGRGDVRIVTAESVSKGHPDKLCDQIADRILDAHLREDPAARVAVEAFATADKLLVAGEVTSAASVDYVGIVEKTLGDIGYKKADLCNDREGNMEVEVLIHGQSRDITRAVGGDDHLGAGDQGIMVGYATDETTEFLPLPVALAHNLCRAVDKLRSQADWLRADGKAQVSVAYENGRPVSVTAVVVSVQHDPDASPERIWLDIVGGVVLQTIPPRLITGDTRLLINPSGRFILGGPVADTGLTGRKLAVDQYGPVARIGGGALSGKDPTKGDRSGAYMARYIAKNIVAAGLAKRCEIQLAYAIGREEPVGVLAETFGTSPVPNGTLSATIGELFDFRPAAIIRQLNLNRPIYAPLAAYGHFGRPELKLPWERTDKARALIDLLPRFGAEG